MMFVVVGTVAGVLTLGWAVYTYYKPRTPQPPPHPPPQPPEQQTGPRLSQSLPAEVVTSTVIFLDWIQKNNNGYVQSYPSYVAIRPYLTILQQDGFIEESSVSNLDGTVYELTSQGRKLLIAAGVKLV